MKDIRQTTFNDKLDRLDGSVGRLERDRQKAFYVDDTRQIDEAKAHALTARDAHNRGELQKAWFATEQADYAISCGRSDLNSVTQIMPDLQSALMTT